MKYKIRYDLGHPIYKNIFRIEALKDFGDVKKGDLGGYIEKESNLSQIGDCWVSSDAWVYGDAQVSDNALVYGNAQVSGNAAALRNAKVYGYAWVSDNARVSGNAHVFGRAWVFNYAQVRGDAQVYDDARVYDNAWILGNARVYDNDRVCDYAIIRGDIKINSGVILSGIHDKTGYILQETSEKVKIEKMSVTNETIKYYYEIVKNNGIITLNGPLENMYPMLDSKSILKDRIFVRLVNNIPAEVYTEKEILVTDRIL